MTNLIIFLGSMILVLVLFGIPVLFTVSLLFHWNIVFIILIGVVLFIELLFMTYGLYGTVKGESTK